MLRSQCLCAFALLRCLHIYISTPPEIPLGAKQTQFPQYSFDLELPKLWLFLRRRTVGASSRVGRVAHPNNTPEHSVTHRTLRVGGTILELDPSSQAALSQQPGSSASPPARAAVQHAARRSSGRSHPAASSLASSCIQLSPCRHGACSASRSVYEYHTQTRTRSQLLRVERGELPRECNGVAGGRVREGRRVLLPREFD